MWPGKRLIITEGLGRVQGARHRESMSSKSMLVQGLGEKIGLRVLHYYKVCYIVVGCVQGSTYYSVVVRDHVELRAQDIGGGFRV